MSDIGEEIISWLHLDDDVSKERDWPHYVSDERCNSQLISCQL